MSKLTDREIIEIIRAYVLQKKYIQQLEEIIESIEWMLDNARNLKKKTTRI